MRDRDQSNFLKDNAYGKGPRGIPKFRAYYNIEEHRERSRRAFGKILDVLPESDQKKINDLHGRPWEYKDLVEARRLYQMYIQHIKENLSQYARRRNGKAESKKRERVS